MSDIQKRLTDYLSDGGLFNPEMADHNAVASMVRDARDTIERLTAERDAALARLAELETDFTTQNQQLHDALRARDAALARASDLEALKLAMTGRVDALTEQRDAAVARAERAEAALAKAKRGLFEPTENIEADASALRGSLNIPALADARLIAAAPEMLDALKMLLDEKVSLMTVNQAARAAIAKAEGGK